MTDQTPLDRLRILVDTGIALSSELSLDALLQQLVEKAALLTSARYAALGVIDQTEARSSASSRRASIPRRTRQSESSPRAAGSSACSSGRRPRFDLRTSAPTRVPSDFRRTTHRCARSWEFRSCSVALRTGTSISPRSTEATSSPRRTRSPSSCSPRRRRRDREHAAVRDIHSLASPSRVVERDRRGPGGRARARAAPGLVARRLRGLVHARIVLIALPEPGTDRLRIAAADGDVRCVWARRSGSGARWVEDRARSQSRPKRAGRLGARRSGDRSAGRAADGCSLGPLRPAVRRGARDRRHRGARQARNDLEPATKTCASRNRWQREPRSRSSCRSG